MKHLLEAWYSLPITGLPEVGGHAHYHRIIYVIVQSIT